jgi:PKD repeat protein
VGKQEITDIPDGRSRYILILAAQSPGANPVSGTFSVATLNFKVIGIGQTALDLYNTLIGDEYANPIPHTAVDGSFTTVICDVEVTKVEPKSTKIIQNNTVEIEVEVKNKGNIPENFAVATYYNSSTTGIIGLAGTQNVVSLAPNTLQELTFDWDTTGIEAGFYYIFANASILEKELNTTNNQLADGTVEISNEVLRDIGITSFTANMTIVAEGEIISIGVTVKNFGFINENNINLIVYYNTTLLETKTFPQITSGSKKEYSFNWNTTGKPGYYLFRANVTILPDEYNPTDNQRSLNLTVTKAPILNFTISPATPVVNQEVTFNASVSNDPDGWIANYTWDFGDSTYLGHGSIVTHRYTSGGTFTVMLIVKDNAGLTYNATRVLTYPYRTEKNVTIHGVAAASTFSEDVLYYVVIPIIFVGVLIVVYIKFPRKPKKQEETKIY